MNLNPGYKQSEVGIIPDEWEVVPISELVSEFRGGAPLKPSDFKNTGIKVLPKGGVGRKGWLTIEDADLQYCSQSYAAAHRNNQVDQNFTIVVLRDLVPSGPSIGLIVQIKEPETFVLAQGVYGFKVNDRTDSRYLIQLSNTRWYRQLMNAIMVGSTQVHITNTAFKAAKIPLPILPEQRAIATALSDVDALLAAQDKLIAKKRDIKQAAMQQLLTGKQRMPGFNGEWEEKPFGEVLSRVNAKEYQIQTTDYQETGDYPVVDQGKELVVGYSDKTDKCFQCPEGGTIVFGDHTCIIKFIDFNFVVGADGTQILSVKNGHHARFHSFQLEYDGISSTGYNRHFKFLKERIFPSPNLSEQIAIAAVLSDMDADLAALEQQRDKTRALKQGMMQVLLTGKIRLTANG